MGWQHDLIRLYELHEKEAGVEQKDGSPILLPLYHQAKKVQLTVRIDTAGNFLSAGTPGKGEEWLTLAPVTELSATRTNAKPKPMHPLCEQLQFLSSEFTGREEEHAAYLANLKAWAASAYSHEKVQAVLAYIRKGTILADVLSCEGAVQKTDAGTIKKVNGVPIEKWMVRFAVANGGGKPEGCWQDPELFTSWINFYNEELSGKEKSACCITGEETYITYSHPVNIRYTGEMAKLFSSNRDQDYTFKGRVQTKEQAYGIGYEASQKLHQALRWVIAKYGVRFGCLFIMAWKDNMEPLPPWQSSSWDTGEIPEGEEGEEVHLLAINSTSTEGKGRLSIIDTRTLPEKEYLAHIREWHAAHASPQYYWQEDKLVYCRGVPGVKAILSLAYGREKDGRLVLDIGRQEEKTALALFRCIAYGDPVPKPLTDTFIRRISHEAFSRIPRMRMVHTACGLLAGKYRKGEGNRMEKGCRVDLDNRDRDYLYGRLLAVADYLEFATYKKEERDNRETNARRYWAAFENDPRRTWARIYKSLGPYLNKAETGLRLKCAHLVTEIMSMVEQEDRASRARLGPMYLFGYSDQTEDLRTFREETEEEQEEKMKNAALKAAGEL